MLANDCFYRVLELMGMTFLEKHFGANFMASPTWLGDYI
jgi:hypothetical protein